MLVESVNRDDAFEILFRSTNNITGLCFWWSRLESWHEQACYLFYSCGFLKRHRNSFSIVNQWFILNFNIFMILCFYLIKTHHAEHQLRAMQISFGGIHPYTTSMKSPLYSNTLPGLVQTNEWRCDTCQSNCAIIKVKVSQASSWETDVCAITDKLKASIVPWSVSIVSACRDFMLGRHTSQSSCSQPHLRPPYGSQPVYVLSVHWVYTIQIGYCLQDPTSRT